MASDPAPQPKSGGSKPAADGRTKYQTGSVERLGREKIQLAAYNPRQASKDAKRRMRENLKSVGLVGPALVWNRRTGNLVQGHLRLAALDVLEGRQDYTLDVTVVDWPIDKEKRQNVFFNNAWAQGEFDLEALGTMLAEDLDHLEGFGLDPVEIQHLFPDDDRFGKLFADVEPEESSSPGAKAALDEIEAAKDEQSAENARARAIERQIEKDSQADATKKRRADFAEVADAANATDFYLVVVCRDGGQCTEVLTQLGVANTASRYVSAEVVLRALGDAQGTANDPSGAAPAAEPSSAA